MFFASDNPELKHLSIADRESARGRELVVLVHGLSAKRLVMWPLARYLVRVGFQVNNWGYRSTTRSIDWHASKLTAILRDVEFRNDIERIHVVAHSMGCIVSRAAIEKGRPSRLGRIVMLAPPNHGSHAARIIAPAVNWFCPTMKELGDHPDSYVNSLPLPDRCEFGVIAASLDRVIRQTSTHLDGEADFTVVFSMHGVLPWHRKAQKQTVSFLESGRFVA